jgi:hypothetical protein
MIPMLPRPTAEHRRGEEKPRRSSFCGEEINRWNTGWPLNLRLRGYHERLRLPSIWNGSLDQDPGRVIFLVSSFDWHRRYFPDV